MQNSLVKLLKNTVDKFPAKEAVAYKNRRISYEELWRDVCSIASFLQSNGVNKEDRVAILIENSPAYIAAYYGILAAGGTVVSLNAAAKSRDLVNWLRHSEAKWLFAKGTHPELLEITNILNRLNIVYVGDSENISMSPQSNKWNEVVQQYTGKEIIVEITNSHQIAAIIYTSGTTGRPKGVTLSHNNLLANIASIITYLDLKDSDRILNVLPFHYSYGNSVLHTHIAVGGSLVLENSMMFPKKVLEKMVSEKVTGFSGVPSNYALILSRTNLKDYDLSPVRYMTQAGGPMAPASIERLTKELPDIQFFVMYGQTEATARLTYLPHDKLQDKMGSVGLPIPGVKIRICNDNGELVNAGESGEIQVQGENVMLGYWRDIEATQVVIKNGWLHTGDLAHWDDDGYIYIDGRSSDMIKTGANRVSPKEIEEIILELEGIEEVVVVGDADEILGQVIKAVLVLSPGNTLLKRDVQAYCHKNLASYKTPKTIEFVTELPKTSSGKVRRFMLQNTK